MRVALLQIRQDAKSRAANLQGITRAIDRAARNAPAPDLLILPGGCDTGGGPARSGLTDALIDTVRETIAAKAREWGVYIAAGLHVRDGQGVYPCAVLFDADGDRVAVSGNRPTAEPMLGFDLIHVWHCLVGSLGVIEASSLPLGEGTESEGLAGALIVWPRAAATTAKRDRVAQANLAILRGGASSPFGAFWGVVTAAGVGGDEAGDEPATFLCDPDGQLVASAPDGDESIVHVEIPLALQDRDRASDSVMRGGQAD